jgi:hypothetical protein
MHDGAANMPEDEPEDGHEYALCGWIHGDTLAEYFEASSGNDYGP